MTPIDLGPKLQAIADEKNAKRKDTLLEKLIGHLLCCLPGLELDGEDVLNRYKSEEIDLIFWNDQLEAGLRFLDCPLVVECKYWSVPVPGREVRYFATQLKDKGRRNGIFIALRGITGNEKNLTAAFFHTAAAMIEGVTVLVITGNELADLTHAEDLIPLLKRKLLEMTRLQIRASKEEEPVTLKRRPIKTASR